MAAMPDPAHVQLAAEAWIRAYERRPKATVFTTITVVVALVATGVALQMRERAARESARMKTFAYEVQIKQLNDVERNLRELLSFFASQKTALRATEDAIVAEEREGSSRAHRRLGSTVEAIFRAQEERVGAAVWWERGFGFISGVLASILAAFIWSVVATPGRRRRSGVG